MPLNKRFILQFPKLSEPNNHQPTKQDSAYLDPIARLQNSVPTAPNPDTPEQAGTPPDVPETASSEPGTLDGTRDARVERLSALLAEILAGTHQTPVFAPDLPLEHEEKLELAKLVIEQKLGLKKTIWVLWGVTRGGRNHQLFVEARKMLKNLKGISDSEDDLSEDDLDDY